MEEVRIGFQFDMSEKVFGKLQLPRELLLDLIGFHLDAQELPVIFFQS